MKQQTNPRIIHPTAMGALLLIFCVGLTVAAPQSLVAADKNSEVVYTDSLNKNGNNLIEFKQFFDDPALIELYSRALGTHGNAVVVRIDTTSDSTEVEVQLRRELDRVRRELQRTQEELQKIDPEVRKDMNLNMQELQQNLDEALQELNDPETLQELQRLQNFEVRVYHENQRPFLGISVADLDFQEAYEMHYNYNYGVLITGVVEGTPADQAGLRKGDIIMEFNGGKARHREVLKNMIDSKSVGDTVKVKVFRDEDIFTTNLLLEPKAPTISSKSTDDGEYEYEYDTDTENEDWEDVEEWDAKDFGFDTDSFFSAGYGGGGWIPYYSMVDLSDINGVISDLGFNKFPENGLLLNGGGGQGPVGKGWFIGGAGAGYSYDRKNTTTSRRMKFSTGFGGVTLDKRYRPSENIVLSTGMLIGGAHTSLEVAQTQGRYDWDSLHVDLTGTGNSYLKMEKSYLLLQPRVSFMYRILPWMAIRTEVSYFMGFSFQPGWEAKMGDENYNITNSPDSNTYQGLAFSIGPWFGF